MNYLNCDELTLYLHDNQLLSCKYKNEEYQNVKLIRCFPMSKPSSYISLCYEKNEENIEIGIIEDIEKLDEKSKEALIKNLSLRYFIPTIIKINKRSFKSRYYTFLCMTSSGEKEVIIKDIGYNIFVTPNKDLLIKDVDENYYIIPSFSTSKDKHVKFIRSFL